MAHFASLLHYCDALYSFGQSLQALFFLQGVLNISWCFWLFQAALTPLGGAGQEMGGYKGFGWAAAVELMCTAFQVLAAAVCLLMLALQCLSVFC